MLMQFLRLEGQGASTALEPTKNARDAERLGASRQPPDGFLIGLIEMTNATAEVRARFPGAVGTTFCILTVMNMRWVRR